MDSVTPHYDNTNTESLMSFHSTTMVDDVSQINRVLLHLIRTIDLDELITTYFVQLKAVLPLTAISLCFADKSIARGAHSTNNESSYKIDLSSKLRAETGPAPSLSYWFSRSLNHHESSLSAHLHDVFCHPLQHAIHVANLERQATKDALTGLGNRAAFNESADKLRIANRRDGMSFGLLVMDLDNFKAVNDRHGHDEGDAVLNEVAACLTDALRANEQPYRFGGDEFCIVLDTQHNESVCRVAARVQHYIENSRLLAKHNITVSIGGTMSMLNESVNDTFRRADKALYQVKLQGKHGYLLA